MAKKTPTIDLGILDTLVATLRAPDGCPWDREQGVADLRAYLLEEAHEVASAIDREDWDGLREEMGDLLFQLAFLGRLNEEAGRCGLEDSIAAVHEKMVERHPHVFGDEVGSTSSEEVARAWERRKVEQREASVSLLEGVSPSLPSLVASYRMTQKAAGVGFDWDSTTAVLDKVREELDELDEARGQSRERAFEEIGDLLFSIANLARHLNIDPEAALARANLKFRSRFGFIEKSLADRSQKLTDSSRDELEQLWRKAKVAEKA